MKDGSGMKWFNAPTVNSYGIWSYVSTVMIVSTDWFMNL